MIISIYGAGYVGLVSAVCFAKLGHQVTCCDIDESKIASLSRGECHFYEEGINSLLSEQLSERRLVLTSDIQHAITNSSIHFIATGTPDAGNGEADLTQVFNVALKIALLAQGDDNLIVIKSTVPVGTGDEIENKIQQSLKKSNQCKNVMVASNPEFLREGRAIADFLHPDRIIIGGEPLALLPLKHLYQPLTMREIPLVEMNRTSAELTKYAANTMLASRISFINHISQIAEKVDANIDDIYNALSLDARIGSHFLKAGIGYGGSCFPKDIKALTHTVKKLNLDTSFFESIDKINHQQKDWAIAKLRYHFNNNLNNLKIGLWGLAFKPGTDDIREASSIRIINSLLKEKAKIFIYDPRALNNVKRAFPDNEQLEYCFSPEEIFSNEIDALVIATEWEVFKNFSLESLAFLLNKAPIFDGRNCYDLNNIKSSNLSYYYSVGRPTIKNI